MMASRLVLVTLGFAMLWGCGSRSTSEESGGEPNRATRVAVEARTLEPRTFEDVISVTGQWKSSGEIVIAAPFAGTVDAVHARVGDRVPRGWPLVTLTTRESEAALRGAELLSRQDRTEAGRSEADRGLALARRELVRVPLTAPSGGIVVRRSAEPGVQVAEAAELLALVRGDAVVFEARVPAADVGRVRPGQRATITGEGFPSIPATVQRILPTAGAADQMVLVWLSPRSGSMPALDRFGAATIVVGTPRIRVAVPDAAVIEDDLTAQKRVAVIRPNNIAVWMPVVLGTGSMGWHELRSPSLPAGTRVIVEGQHGLPDSTRVITQK